ncbi:hypothetical protein C0995_008144, partial [Termitomyces sp. Mi166
MVADLETLTVIDYEDPSKKIFVTTDASNRRTGAIYDSYQLNAAQRNYPTHEKELLAIVKALK